MKLEELMQKAAANNPGFLDEVKEVAEQLRPEHAEIICRMSWPDRGFWEATDYVSYPALLQLRKILAGCMDATK